MPDMAYSEAAESYTPNPNFADSITMQVPPEGTIPKEMVPYRYPLDFDGQKQAGAELVSPVPMTGIHLMRGKEVYDIFCANCHGPEGRGDGHLYTGKLFTAKPTSLVDKYVQDKPAGEIYHVITLGSLSGLMGPHGAMISPQDRWKVVMYVKNRLSVNP